MRRRLAALGAGLFLSAFAGAAQASIVEVRPDASITPDVFIPALIGQVEIQYGTEVYSVTTGPFAMEKRNPGDSFWTQFVSYCLELRQNLNFPAEYSQVGSSSYFNDSATADALGTLVNLIFNENVGFADNLEAMAMQLVLWETIEDGAGTFDLTDGLFRVLDTDAVSRAESIWALVTSGNFQPVQFTVLASANSQDLIDFNVVPVPGALLLFLSGLAGVRFAGRRA